MTCKLLRLIALLPLGLLLLAGNTTKAQMEHPMPQQGKISLGFHSPLKDQEIHGTEVFVQIMLHSEADFQIKAPDGTRKPNEGHIDLLLDATLTLDANKPIPEGAGIAHTDEFHTFKEVPAGKHTLTAVLVDGAHHPITQDGKLITATVRFTTISQSVQKFDDLSALVKRTDLDGDGDLDLVLISPGGTMGHSMAQSHQQLMDQHKVIHDQMQGMHHMMGEHDKQMHGLLEQLDQTLHSTLQAMMTQMSMPEMPMMGTMSQAPAAISADIDGDGDTEVIVVGAGGASMGHPMEGMKHKQEGQAAMEHAQCVAMMGAEMPHDPKMHDRMRHSNPSAEEQSYRMDHRALAGWLIGGGLVVLIAALVLLR